MHPNLQLCPSVSPTRNVLRKPPASTSYCITNEECSEETTCIDLVCEDPSLPQCITNEECSEETTCIDLVSLPQCITNEECSEETTCIDLVCEDPCLTLCTGNSTCKVHDPLPQCITNEECSEETTCIDLVCEDPCLTLCTGNSTCKVHDHVPYCSCKPGYAGDPFTGCRESITAPPQCITNSDCPEDRVCVGKRCKDPCLLGVCDKNSTCPRLLPHPLLLLSPRLLW
ncbi:keratin-associated protein 10-4-like [Homalodisca vitripennis]|uniref:keratin-associated protein 10-4-like n=1 Tax=Homalodisca vitripennis TaxID=197043 RepID=UPI001EEA3F5D|nr:keratin-associated protein 10-4-like [Homalodisca vitripennis]